MKHISKNNNFRDILILKKKTPLEITTIFTILFVVFSLYSFRDNFEQEKNINNNPIIEKNIFLKDGDNFPKTPIENLEEYYKIWGGSLIPALSETEISNEVSLILKSYENEECKASEIGYKMEEKLFDLGYLDIFRYKTFHWLDYIDDFNTKCIQEMYSSKLARSNYVDFIVKIYSLSEKSLPVSYKYQLISYINDSLNFLKTYSKNRGNYYEMERRTQNNLGNDGIRYVGKMGEFIGTLGHYNAFLFRRIEKDKIPVSELNEYLLRIKKAIKNSILNSHFSNHTTIKFNNNGLHISDYYNSNRGFNNRIKIWSTFSSDTIYVNNFSQIKYISDKGKNYYKVTCYDEVKAVYNYNKFGYDFLHNKKYSENETSILLDENLKIIYSDTKSTKQNKYNYSDFFRRTSDNSSSNKVKLNKKGGVFYIPIKVNGLPMEFIYDTGASTVSISLTEAMQLYKNGKLAKSDILGSQYFSDANGDISEGTKIILRELKIGNKILYNVEASIVHNLKAPLLLGQTALNRFGKIIFDTKNQTLTLE